MAFMYMYECFSRLICVYQSTDAIRKRHLYIHISRLMQSENRILLLFYIFLSHGNGKKKKKGGGGAEKSFHFCQILKKQYRKVDILRNVKMRLPRNVALS
jgi:hypothetical protein